MRTNADPTPINDETPATGPHSMLGSGDSRMIAVAELVQELYEENL